MDEIDIHDPWITGKKILWGALVFFLCLFSWAFGHDQGNSAGMTKATMTIAAKCYAKNEFKITAKGTIYMFSCNKQKEYLIPPWDGIDPYKDLDF